MHLGERARPHFAFFWGGSSSLYWGNHLENRSTRSELALLMCRRCGSTRETALTTHFELDFELRARSGEAARHAGGVATRVTLPPNQSIPSIHQLCTLTDCSDCPETWQEYQAMVLQCDPSESGYSDVNIPLNNPKTILQQPVPSVFSHFSFQGFLVLVQAKQANKVEK